MPQCTLGYCWLIVVSAEVALPARLPNVSETLCLLCKARQSCFPLTVEHTSDFELIDIKWESLQLYCRAEGKHLITERRRLYLIGELMPQRLGKDQVAPVARRDEELKQPPALSWPRLCDSVQLMYSFPCSTDRDVERSQEGLRLCACDLGIC